MDKSRSQKKIGQYLKSQRVKAGMTQSDVAQKLGYTSPQFISNIERGLCSAPVKHLKDFAKMYRLDSEDLISLLLTEHENILREALGLTNDDSEIRSSGESKADTSVTSTGYSN